MLKEGSGRGCGSGAKSLIRCVLLPVCSQKVEECVESCQDERVTHNIVCFVLVMFGDWK